jgi:hypothetical protein
MNVIVWLFAISILLLAGCGSSASVTAISDPPIPSTAQAASGPATLQNGFFVQGSVLCVVVTAKFTCGFPLAPVTGSWAASALPVTPRPQAPGRPSPSAPEAPRPAFSGSLDGVSGYYITVGTSGSLFAQVTTDATGSDSTLMGLVASTANTDDSYSFTGQLITQSGTVDVGGEAALFDVDAGLTLALYAVSSDGQTRVAVIGEAAQ